MILDQVISSLY